MAEQDETDKYVKCNKCRCKYINDDEHIKTDFGYNRLNERCKTCVECRDKKRNMNSYSSYKEYYQENRDAMIEKNKQCRENNKDAVAKTYQLSNKFSTRMYLFISINAIIPRGKNPRKATEILNPVLF